MSSASTGMYWNSKKRRNDDDKDQKRRPSSFRRLSLFRRNKQSKNTNEHHFRFKCNYGTVSITNGTNAAIGTVAFRLDNIQNVAELTALYDQYKLGRCIVEFFPRNGAITTPSGVPPGNINNAYSNVQPFITVLDEDDSGSETRVQLLQYSTSKLSAIGEKHVRSLVPSVAASFYQSGIATGYGAKKNQWIDCANSSVPHYGVKYSVNMDNNISADTVLYDIYVTMYVTMKGVR